MVTPVLSDALGAVFEGLEPAIGLRRAPKGGRGLEVAITLLAAYTISSSGVRGRGGRCCLGRCGGRGWSGYLFKDCQYWFVSRGGFRRPGVPSGATAAARIGTPGSGETARPSPCVEIP